MKATNNPTTPQNHPASPALPMLIGAGIGFILISFFVFGVDNPSPDWPKFWYIRPLIVTPVAGAMGGAFYYLMDYLSSYRGLNRTVAVILSVIVFFVGLWLGTVLGLAGTMWN
ncbi:MAG TPA: hypothetical protein VGE26_12220 [Sphingobacteriaceae bacterium]